MTAPMQRTAIAMTAGAWAGLVAFETLAQVALKVAGTALEAQTDWLAWLGVAIGSGWAWLGVLGYVGSFLAWMIILDRLPLSLGFPLTSVVYITVTAASVLVFHEEMGLLRMSGVALIILGVVVLGTERETACDS